MKISKKGLSMQEKARWKWAATKARPKWFNVTYICLSVIGLLAELVLAALRFDEQYWLAGFGLIIATFLWGLSRRLYFARQAGKMSYAQIKGELERAPTR